MSADPIPGSLSWLRTPEICQLEAVLCYVFVDSTRIRILYALNECPRTVTEPTRQLGSHWPKISRHLKVLRNLGLIDVLDILRDVLQDHITGKAVMMDKTI